MILFSDKKGNVGDLILVLVGVFMFAITIVVSNLVIDAYQGQANSTRPDSLGTNLTEKTVNDFPRMFDNIFLFTFVLLILMVVGSVFLIDSYPFFFFISLVSLIGIFAVAIGLANVYDDSIRNSALATFANHYPYVAWVMGHFLELSIGIGFLIIIALYAKLRSR